MIVKHIVLIKTYSFFIFISFNYWKYIFSIQVHFFVLNNSVHYRMYIFCNHYMSLSVFYKKNSISCRLIDHVWINRMCNKSISQSYKPFLVHLCTLKVYLRSKRSVYLCIFLVLF